MLPSKNIRKIILLVNIIILFIIIALVTIFSKVEKMNLIATYLWCIIFAIYTLSLAYTLDRYYNNFFVFLFLMFTYLVFISLLIYFTGGISSRFFVLYLLPMLFSAFVYQLRGMGLTFIIAIALYLTIFFLTTTPESYYTNLSLMVNYTFFFILISICVGYLAYAEEKYREEIRSFFINSIEAISGISDIKRVYLRGHRLKVVDLALKIADELKLTEDEKTELRYVCLFHDLGFSLLPDGILNKKGEFTDEERKIVQEHYLISAELFEHLDKFKNVVLSIRHLKERYDGKGYPAGLKKDEIPLLSRIVNLVDSYYAMQEERPYRRKLTKDETINELNKEKGKQFDPQLVEILIKIEKE